jgi:MinD-like ATPase involved in chromosome partitioning or flagellar assembly
METVAFYSYKGGVGRTLLVANTAQFLAMSGCRVVAIDLDFEAPGLHQKLGTSEIFNRARTGVLMGAVDALLCSIEGKCQIESLREYGFAVDLPASGGGSLLLIPAGAAPSHVYWEKLEQLNNLLRIKKRGGGLLEAILELQARIADEFSPDFLLIDSRTGITELGGFATSILADRVVCLTTTAPESVEGTRVVADALRAAPRLSSQGPLQIDFLITRVASSSGRTSSVSRIIEEFGGSVAVLPHDSGIANRERVLSGLAFGESAENQDDDSSQELFPATLKWIAESFPIHKDAAEVAQRRMQAVHQVWQHLTRASERVRGGTHSRSAWPLEQLRERVRFGKGKKSRQADIVVYDAAPESSTAKPQMIVEYVTGEDRDVVARWWLSETRVPVVGILSDNDQRLYSGRAAWDPRAHHSDRWDLPLPDDFRALSDPTDVSIDAMLDSVRRGHPECLSRIVTEWVRSSASGLHGGAPWKPYIAKRIIDGLARVDDVELARRVLWATSPDLFHRGMWLGDGDDGLDEQVVAELFTPLLWRLPPEAAIEFMTGRGRRFGPPSGLAALALLARNLLGLRYDPDATFRVEGQRMLEQHALKSGSPDDEGIYKLAPAFKHTEVSFEISSACPPLLECEHRQSEELHRLPIDMGRLVADKIASASLVTTGLLGDYQPHEGRVVLYSDAISQCADNLALKARHVGSITLIHETIHALTHLGRDLDGRMWAEFSLPTIYGPFFEPSWFHETITQYFTYQHLLALGDPLLLQAFEVMSARQAPAYRAWERLRSLPHEDARNWFMNVRRGTAGAPLLWHLLLGTEK